MLNDKLSTFLKHSLLNHYNDFPTNIKVEILYKIKDWVKEILSKRVSSPTDALEKSIGKLKVHALCPLTNALDQNLIQIIGENEHDADILEEYHTISHIIKINLDVNNKCKDEIMKYLRSQSISKEDCANIYRGLSDVIKRNGIRDSEIAEFLLFRMLKYKLDGFSTWLDCMYDINQESVYDSYSTRYFSMLLTWVNENVYKCKNSFKYDYLNDIAIGIYLFLSEFGLNPQDNDDLFILWLKSQRYGLNSYTDLIHKKIVELCTNDSDVLVALDLISDKSDFVLYFTDKQKKRITENLKTAKLSEENSCQTLLFGDNIIEGRYTPREFIDRILSINMEVINDYAPKGSYTTKLSENSKMYLRDTKGIKLLMVYEKDCEATVCKYDGEIYLLFEPIDIQSEIIYGLSIESFKGERKLLSLKKDKVNYDYKLVIGGNLNA